MKKIKVLTAVIIVAFCSHIALTETPVEMGNRLMKINNDRPVFQKVKTKASLVICNSSGEIKFTKSLIMGNYTDNFGTPESCEKFIAYFMAPPDDQGNSFLMYHYKDQSDIKWIYLKGIRKAKKVSGADKKLSFFGSDFSNAEVGKPALLDWTYKYLGDEKIEFNGKVFECYKIESLPKDTIVSKELGCGKRISLIEKKTFLTLRYDFYDENLVKWKEMKLLSFTAKKNIKGQKVYYETGLEMKNVKTGTKSRLLFTDYKFEDETKLRTDIFTEQYLTQKWW